MDGTVRYGRPLGQKVLGYPDDFAARRLPLELDPPRRRRPGPGGAPALFTEPGIQGPIQLRLRTCDGSWSHLEAFGNNLTTTRRSTASWSPPATSPSGSRPRKRLRRSDERFRALVQNLSDVVTIVGPDGQLAYSSPAAEQLFGFTEGDESWTDPMARVHPDDLDRVVEEMSQRLEQRRHRTGRVPAPHRRRLVP